eukprot:m.956304 g.956304  ORF g.956304 m.956304 type:complete len:665 (+) comp23872_c0_seq45:311-2305(+)
MSTFTCTTDEDCLNVLCGGDTSTDTAVCKSDGVCTCRLRSKFFIALGMYLAVVFGIALYSYKTSQRARGLSSNLRDHFMASGNFGAPVMILALFSTVFSGYTVVGVPQEAATAGYSVLRWLNISPFVNVCALIFFPRLRQIGKKRHYSSPTDVFSDRFNCNSLRLLTSLVVVTPLFIYTAVQFRAMGDILDGVTLGRIDTRTTLWIICLLIIVCEIIGGQRSVTMSDTIQAGIMLLSFVLIPCILLNLYGGLGEIVGSNCARSYVDTTTGVPRGCMAYSRPWVERQPTTFGSCNFDDRFTNADCLAAQYNVSNSSQLPYLNPGYRDAIDPDDSVAFNHVALSMIAFNLNLFPFALNAHVLQKIYATKTDEALKFSFMALIPMGFIAVFAMAYTGFVRAATFSNVAGSAFPVITSELIDRGGFSEIVAVIASCSAVAAVMSTADSTIIGANNVLTVEWGKHLFCPWATDRQLAYVSKVVCPVFAVGALLFSFASADMNFGTLMNLQGSFNWQTVPAFYVACFSDAIAAHPLLYGQLVGVMVCIALEIAAASEGNVGLHHNNTGFDMYIPSGLWGAMANVATVLVSQRVLVHIGSPLANDDTRVVDTLNPAIVRKFGPARLTAEFIGDSIIADTVEPMASTRNQLICFAALFLLVVRVEPFLYAFC